MCTFKLYAPLIQSCLGIGEDTAGKGHFQFALDYEILVKLQHEVKEKVKIGNLKTLKA